ncbi:MAG: ferrous iron transport protein B [Ruminococcus sp.]|nr:ferrous iron transport protein B [Ruminococcus sp.]
MNTLRDTKIGETISVRSIGGEGALRQHFLDMGIIPGAEITVVQYAPMGDPMELRIHGYTLTLRLADAEKIEVTPADSKQDKQEERRKRKKTEHPGLGEAGRFHPEAAKRPIPKDAKLTFALVGNQNSGKTTLFNRLTGSKQHVGNFPGVTVDRKDGEIKGRPGTLITDLPGIYSMSPYSSEEIVSRNFVIDKKPSAIINIVDVTNIERNLYLTTQLIEMNIPMVVALNMMDELIANSGGIDINLMEEMLGVPVVAISAAKDQGIDELIDHAMHVAYYQEKPLNLDLCAKNDHGGAVHRCIHSLEHLIEDHAEDKGLPLRFAASKVAENDDLVIEQLGLDDDEKQIVAKIIRQTEKERGLDINAAVADMRFAFIMNVCRSCVTKPKTSREQIRSRQIDRILTGKYTAIPSFIVIMALVFWLTFGVIGAFLQGLLENGIEKLTDMADKALTHADVNSVIHSLIINGIFEGVGSVLSFLPLIVILFFFLSILEDSGYIARVAFVMDKILRRLGLSGRSIVPMLIGFGCTVPAVMSTRTLPSERDRKMTILLTPFMSCTAKLPIYAFFINAFFPKYKAVMTVAIYLLGILVGILAAILYKKTVFKGEAVPFVMELPNYRLPGARNVMQLLWEKAKDFLQKAFSVILVATVAIWFLKSFDFRLNMVKNSEDSMLAMIAGTVAPVFKPIGLGSWKITVSLTSGFMAKESVVSTLKVLYKSGVTSAMSSLSALSLLVFSLLYTPCVAAVASIKRELGRWWAAGLVLWQCFIAYAVTLIVRAIAILMGVG